jgi:Histidine kinase
VCGVVVVGSPLPADTEPRLHDFTDLVAIAISAGATCAEAIASRARIVAATDDARRRFECDLHDGAQQQLTPLALQLRTAEASVPLERLGLKSQLAQTIRN